MKSLKREWDGTLVPMRYDCENCGKSEDLSLNTPFIRIEVINHHERGFCVKVQKI